MKHTQYYVHAIVIALLFYCVVMFSLPWIIKNPIWRLPFTIIGVLVWLKYCQQFINWIETKMPMLIEWKNKIRNLKFKVE